MSHSVQHFHGDSYPAAQRWGAWREFLTSLGLALEAQAAQSTWPVPSGLVRGARGDTTLWRVRCDGLECTPVAKPARAPLLLLPLDAPVDIIGRNEGMTLGVGQLGLAPRDGHWRLRSVGAAHLIGLVLSEAALQGRRSPNTGLTAPRYYQADGMAGVLAQMMETVAARPDKFTDADWLSLEHSLADLFFCLPQKPASDGAQQLASAGLMGRVAQLIEANLSMSDLDAEYIARRENISERYLHRLFGQAGDTFKHYLRERRLLRAQMMLSAPDGADVAAASVAFACGFDDAANFSRQFKLRFGLPPQAWRKRELERQRSNAVGVENRGWPVAALGSARVRMPSLEGDRARIVQAASAGPGLKPVFTTGALHRLEAKVDTVHWGFFSRNIKPVLRIKSGDQVEIETLSQHASDAPALMIQGDAAAEEVFYWDGERKNIDRRGAGPMDGSIFGRGAGEGFGVHICTGPIEVEAAEPGDVIEVRIDDITPRPSQAPGYEGRCFGSNVAAWWGYHYPEQLSPPQPHETVTIFEIHPDDVSGGHAEILYSYRWVTLRDPFGVSHPTYDYPGIPVDADRVMPIAPPDPPIRVPLRPHFGVIAVAPRENELIDSVPPSYFGGNIDNWRLGRGASVYLPVSVPGGLLSIGDPHAAQGDGELDGTAIECSMTGRVTVVLHKRGSPVADIESPLLETPDAWILTGFSHPDYLAEFGTKGFGEVYEKASLDLAMRDAFRKVRRFLMSYAGLSEDHAIALISASVDFGVTQVVDGNLGVHAIVPKSIFADKKVTQ